MYLFYSDSLISSSRNHFQGPAVIAVMKTSAASLEVSERRSYPCA